MQKLKEKLLNTGHFIDNSYLDDYVKLVNKKSTANYLERHHILPRAYYNLEELEVDSSEANLAALSFADHCKAHWLLYYCTVDRLQYASQTAFIIMVNGLTKRIKDYTEADFIALQEMKNQLLEDSNTFWSAEDDNFLKQYFQELTDEELASKLNRTEIAVRARRSYLNLQRFNMLDFTDRELDYIITNYYQKEIKEIAADLNRSVGSIAQKCHRLGLKKKADIWSKEELDFLRANSTTMSLMDLSNALNRSKLAIKRQCHVHNIERKRTDLWTEAELKYLKDNYLIKTYQQMAAELDRTANAISHRCQVLNLIKNKHTYK